MRFAVSRSGYGRGRGVVATEGGRTGYVTSGCSPVSEPRNAVILSTSSSVSFDAELACTHHRHRLPKVP